MVHFVGAGCGAADLITVRGRNLLMAADVIIYAGSLINPDLLKERKDSSELFDSAHMTLEEVFDKILEAEGKGLTTVRLHSGDASIYGAIREQMDLLDSAGIPYDVTPGVSALNGAASSMNLEYTLPGISQSVIITRMEGRTPVPEKERLSSLAEHQATMAIFLSAGKTGEVKEELLRGGYSEDTPAAIAYKATWPEERCFSCTVGTLPETAEKNGIRDCALILVGEALSQSGYDRSKLYDPGFETGYRKAEKEQED